MPTWSLTYQQSVFKQGRSNKHFSAFYLQDGSEKRKLRNCHPMYKTRLDTCPWPDFDLDVFSSRSRDTLHRLAWNLVTRPRQISPQKFGVNSLKGSTVTLRGFTFEGSGYRRYAGLELWFRSVHSTSTQLSWTPVNSFSERVYSNGSVHSARTDSAKLVVEAERSEVKF